MAHLDLEDQEQLAQLKSWWATYGNLIVAALVIAALVSSGWQGWRFWQDRQAGEASNLFEVLTKAQAGAEPKAVRDASGELLEKYPRTLYASMGALTSAKYFFDKGDNKTAKAQLEWVIEKTSADEFRDVARLRLANVLGADSPNQEVARLARHRADLSGLLSARSALETLSLAGSSASQTAGSGVGNAGRLRLRLLRA